VLGLTRARGPDPNLIALPVDAKDVSAPLAADFASARYFALVDLRTGRIDFVDYGTHKPRETLGLRAAYGLLGRGVGAVVAQGIGLEARNALYSRGVRIFSAPTGNALGAMQMFSSGTLAEFAPPRGRGATPGQPLAYPLPQSVVQNGSPAGATPAAGVLPAAPIGPGAATAPNAWPYATAPAATEPAAVEGSLGLQGSNAATGGVSVLGVRGGSRAHRCGLRLGDVIVKVGQNQVRDLDQLQGLLPNVPHNDSLPLLVARNGEFLQLWLPP